MLPLMTVSDAQDECALSTAPSTATTCFNVLLQQYASTFHRL